MNAIKLVFIGKYTGFCNTNNNVHQLKDLVGDIVIGIGVYCVAHKNHIQKIQHLDEIPMEHTYSSISYDSVAIEIFQLKFYCLVLQYSST